MPRLPSGPMAATREGGRSGHPRVEKKVRLAAPIATAIPPQTVPDEMTETRTFTDTLINAFAVAAAVLSLSGFVYIVHHAFQARREEDDSVSLTANAIAGDLVSQRKMASCYAEGCPPMPQSQIISCAWRRIIVKTGADLPEDRAKAAAACDGLSTVDAGIADNAMRSLEHRIEARRASATPR